MTINLLFEALMGSDLQDKLTGELTLRNKHIIWSYDIKKHADQSNDDLDTDINTDESETDFINIKSSEEILRDAYDCDIELIQDYIQMTGDCIDRTYTEPEISKATISFKFF